MATTKPIHPDPPDREARLPDNDLPGTDLPVDDMPVQDPADLLDVVLEQMADDGDHRNFSDDVRSDSIDDEKHERR